jgi:putative endonuclease
LSRASQELGRWGEKRAAEHMQDRGYSLIAKNVRTPYGEIDLIVQKVSDSSEVEITTVFVEVKTRSSQTFGYPEEAMTIHKQENLISAVEYYLQENPELAGDWRIDVIAIEQYKHRSPIISHFENAVQ